MPHKLRKLLDEARTEFGPNAIVSTLHSYAYHHVIKQYSLGTVRSFLTWRDIPKSIRLPFGRDGEVLSLVDDYCKSEYKSLDEYTTVLKQSDPEADIDQKGSALLREANQNGGKDNIAVVLVEPFTNEVEAC